ncbi:S8 family peptidase [Flavobacterium aciduliphilum]|uniref:Subtilase family protein n=1 Tax=Flavobacterium aciduliphilum TaxID=1101402 RepID=A0A328YJA8_9FLAO|nr:S8 family peptidase [Flavobacterium aciduliphilum]RAR72855.1 subtilase family protein [Flavobacterium aciduliphilum]
MKLVKPLYVTSIALLACASIQAQQKAEIKKFTTKKAELTEVQKKRWSDLDLEKDTIPGMSVDKVYTELLKGKTGKKIIVGVIDSGLDIDHEDLKGKIWTNTKEIPGNNIDDDKNGFVDDVHGWNFLGEGTAENLELTRIVKKGDDGSETYKKAKAELDEKRGELNQQKFQVDMISKADKDIQTYLKKETYTLEDLKTITTTDSGLLRSKMIMMSIASKAGDGFQEEIKSYVDYVYDQLNYNLNVDFNGRKVGDNPDTMEMTHYGNGNVKGPDVEDALHGTHVAGIIAQIRGNDKGGDGVVDKNIEIMAVRAVPNGDEYDKDIALAIRYAVDNGAKVINGSFGKDYSPHKEWVWDAIKYAAKKDVLIVHAAGNDAKDVDTEPNFPTDEVNGKEIADNLITIGALNNVYGDKIVADFSNYGAKNVDVFAPGVEIYATVPNNKYKYEQGTSMASPNAAGVAALIRSYYPNLTASQVKHILMDSGTPIAENVVVDETKKTIPFSSACVSGKIVNAYNALLMAEKMSKKTPLKKGKKK